MGSHPTTKRNWQCARASGGMALAGLSTSPAPKASVSRLFQPKTRSAGVRPGSPQSASIAGSSGPPPTSISASAALTEAGIGGGLSASILIRPRASTSEAIALAIDRRGIDQQAAPIARMMRALARAKPELEIERAARAQKDCRALARQAAARRRRSADPPPAPRARRRRFREGRETPFPPRSRTGI